MYNTVQKIIIDPINNEISTPVIINNVAEDVSPLLLVKGEVTVGMMIKEPFEVPCVVSVIELIVIVSVDKPLEVDCKVSVIGLSVIVSLSVDKVDGVVKVIGLLVMETMFDSVAPNIKGSIAVLLVSTVTVVVAGEITVVVDDTTMYTC